MTDAPLIRIPDNPVPDGFSTEFIAAGDGAPLRIATWAKEGARGTVLVHPGWAEFIEKYIEVAEELHTRGFNVVIADPRGQGYSHRVAPGDDRALIRDFRQFSDDMDVFVAAMRARFAPPYLILAHSMGGLITLQWLASGKGGDISAVALVAPLTRLFSDPVKQFIARNVARMAGVFGPRRQLFGVREQSLEFEGNTLTQDPRRHERFRQLQLAAPEAQAGPPRFAWLNAAMGAINRINRPGALDAIGRDILLVSADWDETVDPTNHERLAELYPNFRLVRIDNARHEILMEKDIHRERFWTAFDDYVDEMVSSSPMASENPPPEDSIANPSNTKSSRTSAT